MKYIALFFTLIIALNVNAQKPIQKGFQAIDRKKAEAHIEFLANDLLEGRESGFRGGRIAREYIVAQLKQYGIEPLLSSNNYLQHFTAYRPENSAREPKRYTVTDSIITRLQKTFHVRLEMANVLGMIRGKKENEYVIVGAHYDHLGMDANLFGDNIYNGADDNASGVSAVLQLAKAFKESGEKPERTIIFAFWDGEERGLLGSQYFIDKCSFRDNIKSYLNYDMIGRNNRPAEPKHVVYFYTASFPIFETWLKQDLKSYKLDLEPDYRAWDNPVGGSDNGSFAKYKIPIVWFHTDGHPDYHKPTDHADRLNWDKIIEITRASYLIMWKLANDKY
ncbi:M28 family metallopeptidase [Capnocytophaga canis]|uniref:SgaP n=1 Tax=Capnocytophaga canis TaxID=1848903 RepID=A0A0B7HV06_9FLAO|nr:M20/M25/M40 family metallo-hydrolase [Capnocytophaga canis]CEN43175.1 SgaP [Capnocytophaga canis]